MFELQVRLAHVLLTHLAYKYFCIKLGITADEMELITIRTVKEIPGGSLGNCQGIYNKHNELAAIYINIKNQTDLGIIDTMGHELFHARQHLRGEFGFTTRKKKFLWMTVNEEVRTHRGQILQDTEYYDRLCEQEAHSGSRELVRQFLNFVHILENLDGLPEREEKKCLSEDVGDSEEN